MIGLGTAINIGLIIAGSLCGLAFGRFMKENLKQTLMMVSGIIVLLLGMSGCHAVYARYRERHAANDGPTFDDY